MAKKMAMGGLGMDDSDMRNSRMVDRGMERRMKRGREMEGGYGRPEVGGGLPPVRTMGKPALGGGLPPVQNMGPGNMPPGKMMPGAPGSSITQSGAQQGMMQNMGPNNMAPMKMRNGGIARKGKTMAKGGLVKGCGCAAKGVKKPRYT